MRRRERGERRRELAQGQGQMGKEQGRRREGVGGGGGVEKTICIPSLTTWSASRPCRTEGVTMACWGSDRMKPRHRAKLERAASSNVGTYLNSLMMVALKSLIRYLDKRQGERHMSTVDVLPCAQSH